MRKLKVAVLIDDSVLAKYRLEVIYELYKSDWCEEIVFIKKQKSFDPVAKNPKYFFYELIRKLDKKIFAKNTPYLNEESIEDLIKNHRLIEIKTNEGDYFDEIDDRDIEKINSNQIDVILNFGFKYITGKLINSAKYGLWEYRHSNRPAAFWEVVENMPYTEVTLERVGSAFENGYVLDSFKTVTHQKSISKNFEQIMWRSHMMVIYNLRELAQDPDGYFSQKEIKTYFYDLPDLGRNDEKKAFDFQFAFSDDIGKKPPSNLQGVGIVGKLLGKYIKFIIRRFFKMDRWIILFSENKDGKINPDFSSYKRVPLPSNEYFQADPFVVDENEKSYLFYEELDYKTLKGYLLVSTYDEKSETFIEPQVIMKKEYHLSYPNVFKVDQKFYMIVESHENLTIDLYEADVFPTKWKKVRTMMDNIKAVDATLYKKDDKWWMFVNVAVKDGFSLNDELYIFYCDDFVEDEWKPHLLNPVVCDVTSARPAGNLFENGDKLFRPAQNCSGVYGRGLVINEILELNEKKYEERMVQQIRADFADDLVAIHTLNASKRFSVIDAIKSR